MADRGHYEPRSTGVLRFSPTACASIECDSKHGQNYFAISAPGPP